MLQLKSTHLDLIAWTVYSLWHKIFQVSFIRRFPKIMIVLKITLNFNVYSNLPVATDCISSLRDLKRDVVASLFSSNWLIIFYSLPYAASITSWESSLSLGVERGRTGKLLLTVIFRGGTYLTMCKIDSRCPTKSGTQRYFLYKPSAFRKYTCFLCSRWDDHNFPSISEHLADRFASSRLRNVTKQLWSCSNDNLM